jgi:hypothetical protein
MTNDKISAHKPKVDIKHKKLTWTFKWEAWKLLFNSIHMESNNGKHIGEFHPVAVLDRWKFDDCSQVCDRFAEERVRNLFKTK